MGLSASQARFLQLTARRGNNEYEAQQISQQRLQLATKLEMATNEYEDKMSNRKMVFRYNTGSEVQNVDVTYQNYKNIMNQQQEGISVTQQKFYLVSSSGNKLVVANSADMETMIEKTGKDKNGEYLLKADDFITMDTLDDVDQFQLGLRNGDFYFATMNEIEYDENDKSKQVTFTTQSWETLGGAAIQEDYDKTDDAEAEAKFERIEANVQNQDKKLELRLNQLETDRNAIQTEIDSVKKVIDNNIDKTFKTFNG